MDKWDRKTNFNCDSCRYYVPKPAYSIKTGACRRNAPTLKGYPVVYADADWCGEHKIGSNPVRDGKEGIKTDTFFCKSCWSILGKKSAEKYKTIEKCPLCEEKPHPMLCVEHGGSPTCEQINAVNKLTCPKCEEKPELCDICKIRPVRHISYGAEKSKETRCCLCHIAEGGTPADWHPECMRAYDTKKEKPPTKEDARKVLTDDEGSLVMPGEKAAGKNVVLSGAGTLVKAETGQFPCEECCLKYTEEKAKIKAEIKDHLATISRLGRQFIDDLVVRGNLTIEYDKIQKLLEKL